MWTEAIARRGSGGAGGRRVRILLRFEDHPGLFLYHCHMLEHEDSDLMRNYLVKA